MQLYEPAASMPERSGLNARQEMMPAAVEQKGLVAWGELEWVLGPSSALSSRKLQHFLRWLGGASQPT